MQVPLSKHSLGDAEIAAAVAVMQGQWLSAHDKAAEFERMVADYVGVSHAVATNSCTSALWAVLMAAGITGEVILPSFTFAASANAIVRAGATPVFVDIEENTRNIDPKCIEAAITSRTEAIMPVHFAGLPSNMTKIMAIAAKHGLFVVEDAAECLGGSISGQKAGAFGDAACFSFFPTKNITCGEGGMAVTDDPVLADKVRRLVSHGIVRDPDLPWRRDTYVPGMNLRMSDILAAIGVEQMKRVDELNLRRRRVAIWYIEKLMHQVGFSVPLRPGPEYALSWQMFTILLDDATKRDSFVFVLNQLGIGASVHFDPPVHKHWWYSTGCQPDLPITESVASRIVTLPIYPSMTDAEMDAVIDAVKEVAHKLL